MVLDAVRGYVQLASGLGDVTRARAVEIAKAMLAGGRDMPGPAQVIDQVSSLADEIMTQSKANRDLVLTLVGAEVERVVASLGLAHSDDVEQVRRRVKALEADVAALRSSAASAADDQPSAAHQAPPSTPAGRPGAKKAPAKRAPSQSAAGPASAETAPRKRTPRRAPASSATPSVEVGEQSQGGE